MYISFECCRENQMANLADINSYRLTSLDDPPEEFLAQIMKEAAEEARIENEKATKRFFEEIKLAAEKIR